jgi:hypothetical protein
MPDRPPADDSPQSAADVDGEAPSGAVGDHVSPTTGDLAPGVYRVVGTDEERLTLLRVGDAEGHRVVTGQLHRVPRGNLDGFVSTTPPTAPGGPEAALVDAAEAGYWSVRVFVSELLAHPIASAAALAVVVIGWFGVGSALATSLSPLVRAVALFVGSLGLAYVGSGRL